MENIILYTTGCPQCKVLESKLKEKNIEYTIITDIKIIQDRGYLSVPVLEVNNVSYTFIQAIQWLHNKE